MEYLNGLPRSSRVFTSFHTPQSLPAQGVGRFYEEMLGAHVVYDEGGKGAVVAMGPGVHAILTDIDGVGAPTQLESRLSEVSAPLARSASPSAAPPRAPT